MQTTPQPLSSETLSAMLPRGRFGTEPPRRLELADTVLTLLEGPIEGELPTAPPDHDRLVLPISGSLRWGGPFGTVADPSRGVLRHPPLDGTVEAGPGQFLIVDLSSATMSREWACLQGEKGPSSPPRFEPTVPLDGPFGAAVLDLALLLARRLVAPSKGLRADALAMRRLERALYALLLEGQPHQRSAQPPSPPPDPGRERVRRALEYAEAHLDSRLTLGDLAAAAGLSPRVLQQDFARHLGLSPLAWVRQRRLFRAREQLLLEDPAESTVTEVAMAWGFTHLGRFAKRYKETFGEPPSRTLRRGTREAAVSVDG